MLLLYHHPKEFTVSNNYCILFTPTIDLDLTDDNEAGGSDGKTASGGDSGDGARGNFISRILFGKGHEREGTFGEEEER